MYLDGGMGGGGWLLTSFFSIIYILELVCYKHTIHVYYYVHNNTNTYISAGVVMSRIKGHPNTNSVFISGGCPVRSYILTF